MKKSILSFAAVLLFASPSYASKTMAQTDCPDFNGTFTCSDDDGSPVFDLAMTTTADATGNSNYSFTETSNDGSSFSFSIDTDGAIHDWPNLYTSGGSAITNRQYAASCQQGHCGPQFTTQEIGNDNGGQLAAKTTYTTTIGQNFEMSLSGQITNSDGSVNPLNGFDVYCHPKQK